MPDRAEGHERKAFDKSHTAAGGTSIILLLLVALGLICAAGGLIVIDRDYVEAYVLTLLAVLGTVGVFALFALAAGIMKFAGKDKGNPLLKAVVDGAFDGLLVTDQSGRVVQTFVQTAEFVCVVRVIEGTVGDTANRVHGLHDLVDGQAISRDRKREPSADPPLGQKDSGSGQFLQDFCKVAGGHLRWAGNLLYRARLVVVFSKVCNRAQGVFRSL